MRACNDNEIENRKLFEGCVVNDIDIDLNLTKLFTVNRENMNGYYTANFANSIICT
jgi:hypothetical protein